MSDKAGLEKRDPEEGRIYLAYLLRLWQVLEHGTFTWRASLEDARSGERIVFMDLDALIAHLRQVSTGASIQKDDPM